MRSTRFTLLSASLAATATASVIGNGAEWAGIFPTPLNSYIWSAEKVGGDYADPEMNLIAIAGTAGTDAELNELGELAEVAFAGTCIATTNGQTITPSNSTCYKLTFDQAVDQTTFNVDATGAAYIAFYAQHFPIEFEATRHYFYDTADADVEPLHQLPEGDSGHAHGHGGTQESCGCAQYEADHPFTINCSDTAAIRAAGVTLADCGGGTPSSAVCKDAVATDPTCQIAFFIIQSHHDYCLHDTLLQSEEVLFHDWEAHCLGCAINRQYQPSLSNCIVPDCNSPTLAATSHYVLNSTCTANGGAGSCCSEPITQGAFETVVAYHDLCAYDQVPYYIETDFHDYEDACENYFCNAVGPDYDGTKCHAPPSPPTPPPPPTPPTPVVYESSGLSNGAIAGIAIGASAGGLLLLFTLFLVTQEQKGTPVFAKINAPPAESAYPKAQTASAQA